MTVAATTNRKTYTGDNVTTSFATSPVIFYATSDLQVRVTVIATGVSTLLTLNTHYTVSGGSSAGAVGTVSLAGGSSPHGALLSTEKLVILRVLPLTQGVDFVNNNNSDAEVIEAALDKLTDVDQQLSERQDRALTFAEGDVSGSTTVLQDASVRAGKFLGFDGAGILIAGAVVGALTTTIVGQIPFGAAANTLAQDTALAWDNTAKQLTINTVKIGLGVGALVNNIAIGVGTLTGVNTGGSLTAIGYNALAANTLGNDNTALGANALKANTTGNGSTAVGSGALQFQSTGTVNDAFGYKALNATTIGFQNAVFGYQGFALNIDGSSCVGIGQQVFQNHTTGNQNIGVGYQVFNLHTSGANNTAIGHRAFANNLTGASNVGIGFNAGLYELGSNSFYVNNQDRVNTAGDKSLSLMYGVFAATAAAQRLQQNAVVTKPVQPAFLSFATATANITGDATSATVIWAAPTYDQHSDFAANTFTAPVAGKYHFDVGINTTGIAAGNTVYLVSLVATSRTVTLANLNPGPIQQGGAVLIAHGIDIDMALGDTATVTLRVDGGAKIVGYSAASSFSGHLVA